MNGAFAFEGTLPVGSAYEVKVASQPAGTECWIKNSTGTIGESTVFDVRCVVAFSASGTVASGPYADTVLTPTALTGAPSVTFDTDINAKAIVAVTVPGIQESRAFGGTEHIIGAMVDGQAVVEQVHSQSLDEARMPRSLGTMTVVDLAAAAHTATISRRTSTTGAASSSVDGVKGSVISVVVLDSLSTFVEATTNVITATDSSSVNAAVLNGLASFQVAAPNRPALAMLHVPLGGTDTGGNAVLSLGIGSETLAQGTQEYYRGKAGMTLAALGNLGTGALAGQGRSTIANSGVRFAGSVDRPIRLSAATFTAQAKVASASGTIALPTITAVTTVGPSATLTAPRAGKVLVFGQVEGAGAKGPSGGGPYGEIELLVNSVSAASARFASPFSYATIAKAPVFLAAIVPTTPGAVPIQLRATPLGGATVSVVGDVRLGAIFLE